MERRELLVGLGLVGLAASQQAMALSNRDTLIVIFLRGGADGLSMAVPITENHYYDARPNLAIQPPGETFGALNLNGNFGLHPAMAPLEPLYQSGDLAIIPACGLPNSSRSHFSEQDRVESGSISPARPLTGWLGRHMSSLNDNPSPLRSVSFTGGLPVSLRGDDNAITLQHSNIHQWLYQMPGEYAGVLESLQGSFSNSAGIAITLAETLDSIQPWKTTSSVSYSASPFGKALKSAANLVKSGAGSEVLHINLRGWDTHDDQPTRLPNLIWELASGLANLHTDLGSAMQNVTVLVMSEFGRRVAENANHGTDHGAAGCMLAMGGGVNGGKIYGEWPGLEPHNLAYGDLAITTDIRQVLWESLYHRRAAVDPELIFPGFTPGTDTGLFQAA